MVTLAGTGEIFGKGRKKLLVGFSGERLSRRNAYRTERMLG